MMTGHFQFRCSVCLTLCDPMDCSLPGSSVHGIFLGNSTGVDCHFLLPGIFPTQGSNLGLPHCRQTLYHLSHQGSHFHRAGFSLCSASTTGAFAGLGFCCVWPLPCRGQAKVVSAKLNLSHGTRYVGRVCNFLGFVLPQQKLEAVDQCFSFVTAQSFTWQATKESTPSRCEGRLTTKERPQSILASSFYMFISSPILSLLYANQAVCFT